MREPEDNRTRDEALLRRARQHQDHGDAREAAAELMLHYRSHVYQWCYRYVHNHERALDLAQEVLLASYKALPSFSGRASFCSWLFAVTRNRCVSSLRRSSRHPTIEYDLELMPDERETPDRALERREERELLLRAMRETLSSREQEALCLRIFDNMPVDMITEVLGLETASGARSVLQNARRKLRAALVPWHRALEEDAGD
ncbi:MAG: sigma-70 family RNA polymerase sigma factor [Candidatus Krumholzibacteria bacterium]|jgi:RNA polymerase sigma-70 factor (ECF subfamily)|nr:sigma-70 family RNA polymerase sigma factor [Candidatus Krumholzibacteria bacterium]